MTVSNGRFLRFGVDVCPDTSVELIVHKGPSQRPETIPSHNALTQNQILQRGLMTDYGSAKLWENNMVVEEGSKYLLRLLRESDAKIIRVVQDSSSSGNTSLVGEHLPPVIEDVIGIAHCPRGT